MDSKNKKTQEVCDSDRSVNVFLIKMDVTVVLDSCTFTVLLPYKEITKLTLIVLLSDGVCVLRPPALSGGPVGPRGGCWQS